MHCGVATRELCCEGCEFLRGRLDGFPPPAPLLTLISPFSPVLMVEIKFQRLAMSDAVSSRSLYVRLRLIDSLSRMFFFSPSSFSDFLSQLHSTPENRPLV